MTRYDKVFGGCVVMTACLLILSLFLSTQAFAEAGLYVYQSRVNDRCGTTSVQPPLGYFNPTDPTLVSSESWISPTPCGHDDCHDEEFANENVYQSLVEVNHPQLFCVNCVYTHYPLLRHSNAEASGFASADRLRLGAYSEADDGLFREETDYGGRGTHSQAEADANFRKRVTRRPPPTAHSPANARRWSRSR